MFTLFLIKIESIVNDLFTRDTKKILLETQNKIG